MEGSSVKENKVIPDCVMDSVNKTLFNVQQVRTHLLELLSLSDPEVLAEMPPLERAQSLFLLAKATTILFTLRLRCSGVHPDDHSVKSELMITDRNGYYLMVEERLSLYQDKIQRSIDLSKAPLRPSTTLNHQAATRFIEHSLSDLTPEQRQSMKDISRGEGPRIKYIERSVQKKRKYQSSETKNVQAAAKEFLEKAALELLGDTKSSFKGPLQADE